MKAKGIHYGDSSPKAPSNGGVAKYVEKVGSSRGNVEPHGIPTEDATALAAGHKKAS